MIKRSIPGTFHEVLQDMDNRTDLDMMLQSIEKRLKQLEASQPSEPSGSVAPASIH